MVQVRHVLLGLASGSALYSGLAAAIGLGEITLHSGLNQPLVADIELLEVGELTESDMKVHLASDAVFNRSGVDRVVFLSDLRFTPMLRGGKNIVRVVSNKPVREPYLNFIIELARPNGQLFREYTLLLDPPTSSAYTSVAANPAAAATPNTNRNAAAPAKPAAPRKAPPATLGKHYVVVGGDSLWTIATRLRAQGSTAPQQQLMDDIHTLNPQAFSGEDRSGLQVGTSLLLPDAAPVAVAPRSTAADDEPPSTLSVVGDEDLAAPAPPLVPLDASAEMIAQMQKRLDTELALHADENTKLQQSMAELTLQLQQLMAQSASKDQQLADLKAQLAALQSPAPAVAGGTGTAPLNADKPAESSHWLSAVWGFLALLLVALIALLFWRRGRREPAPDAQVVAEYDAAVDAHDDEFELNDVIAPAVVAAPVVAKAPRAPVTVAEPRATSPTDTLEGANIYIAYGRFSEAASSLRRALDAEPQRTDIRFRLLEVLAQLGDARGFQREEELLLDAGFPDAPIAQLKTRHPALFDRQDLDLDLDLPEGDLLDDAVLHLDEAQPLASQPAAVADDQFNLDDFSLDPDWDVISPFSASARSKAEAAQKAETAPDANHGLGNDGDVRSPFSGSSMVVEETHEQGWFGDGVDDGAYLSQPLVEEGESLGDLEHFDSGRENLAKFNQALEYIEQGHVESACDILNELINEGDEEQRREASKLLAKIA